MSSKTKHSGEAEWGSRFGYLMVAAGASIGLGNIWKFPYLAYRGGSGRQADYAKFLFDVGRIVGYIQIKKEGTL